jgi:hypothetical protein
MDVLPHVAFSLVAVSYAVRDIVWLRCLAMVASAVAIAYEGQQWITGHEHRIPSVLWHSIFLAINAYQVWVLVYGERHVRFTDEERVLYETTFRPLTRLEFLRLLRLGRWEESAAGVVLAEQGRRLEDVMLVHSGRAVVEDAGRAKAQVRPGQFIGEMSFVTGEPASATVRVTEPARCLCWRQEDLRGMLARNPSIRFALASVLGVDLSRKLRRAREPSPDDAPDPDDA